MAKSDPFDSLPEDDQARAMLDDASALTYENVGRALLRQEAMIQLLTRMLTEKSEEVEYFASQATA